MKLPALEAGEQLDFSVEGVLSNPTQTGRIRNWFYLCDNSQTAQDTTWVLPAPPASVGDPVVRISSSPTVPTRCATGPRSTSPCRDRTA